MEKKSTKKNKKPKGAAELDDSDISAVSGGGPEVFSGGMSSHYCHNCKQMMYSFGFPKTCPKCGKPWTRQF